MMLDKHGVKLLWILFLLPLGLLLGSLFWQFVLGDQPCSLCLMQRVLLMMLTALAALSLAKVGLRDQWWMPASSVVLVMATLVANVWQILLPEHVDQSLPSGICAVQLGSGANHSWFSALFSAKGNCQDGMDTLLGMPALYWITLSLVILLIGHVIYWVGVNRAKQSQIIAQSDEH